MRERGLDAREGGTVTLSGGVGESDFIGEVTTDSVVG